MKILRALRIGRRNMRDAMRVASIVLNPPWMEPTPFSARAALAPGVIDVPEFGSNPGRLRMFVYASPTPPRPGMPLVVVLHGCGQEAASFAEHAGWMALADRLGIPLLLPEQVSDNNHGGCFNWFRPADIRRGRGEAASIRQMVTEAVSGFRSDPKRVFVAGLSAGGAMAAAVLAAYPDVFAGGAVVSGLPVGSASDVHEALMRMSHAGPALSAEEWADRARRNGPAGYRATWPALSIWRGGEDRVVDPANSEFLAEQWAGLHRLSYPSWLETEPIPSVRRRIWGPLEEPAIEMWTLPRLTHAWPIESGGGQAKRWVRSSELSATTEIARFWSLTDY